ncbi:MAG: hypothetical protein V1885_03385 [Candidatus Brennerbacteria bacterium]
MNAETRNCANCKNSFTIEPDDFVFYERISVPPPTWCPGCRQQRRYSWRNERVLYRRNCDLCGKSTVTIYSPSKPYKVFCPPCWWSDKWDALEYGREFDFSRPFFEQFQEAQLQVPRIALLTKNSVNSEYTNHSGDNKNCYLSFSTFGGENIMYGTNVWAPSKDSMDLYLVRTEGGAERCYECIDSSKIYSLQFTKLVKDSNDCAYCFDCRGCSHCFLSSNLRNKQYYFENHPLSKEEYQKKMEAMNLGSRKIREKLYEKWLDLIKKRSLHKFAIVEKSTGVTGNMVFNSKNSAAIFDGDKTEDSKYSIICPDVKNSMDVYHVGFSCELNYEAHALVRVYDVFFSHLSYDNSHLQYCDSCHNSENLFGCVGLRSKKYCIFNKQYSEEEYKTLRAKIIEHMKKGGEYGEFFPPKLSPFGYNETQGIIYMPLTKEEAVKRGYKWEDVVTGTFNKETISQNEVPDDIKDVENSILKEVLKCDECEKNYNIVEPELEFYRREGIPIPRFCPNCRYQKRLSLRPPRRLWHRQCMCDYRAWENSVKHPHHTEGRCSNEFKTSYAPERPEVVYCEQCYNAEVV